ncbi:TetR/AcrR family transcriptional regulator [Pseudonocardia broussonetiae]|uniref:TetR/AcrR family transcriptional regulator n=1 Tax=Pseudonocardia broussonetiae TaxID=2736640 RepID=A0A6M6JH92_9PSEU|nr:TetR/AcrR family transcriptional regulator [Pseudonocardia broussonetiae]QJY46082.1 TetR/AcrR family transcriptional regulator [Pseudonocardia broussonetiae]
MAQPKNPERSGRTGAPTHRRGLVENEIYEHATRLFAEKGFASTTLQDIADALGVTRPAVYYYFKTKEEILARLVGEITQAAATDLGEMTGRADVSPTERLKAITRLNVTRIGGQAARFRLLIKSESELPDDIAHAHREARRQVLAAFVRVVREGVERGDFRPIDPRTGALGVIGLCNWVAWWYQEGDDIEALADNLAEMAVSSLRRTDERLPPARGTDGALALLREDIDHLEQLLAAERRGAHGPVDPA